MDMSAIPMVQSIVLTGLDFSMKPVHARFESSKGFIKPFPEIKVMHTIKTLAVLIYNQEKLTPYFHKNVCDGRNSLAYFICAMHRQSAPQPMTATPARPASAPNDNNSTGTCKHEVPGKNCELPKLCTTSMLPLGYWDSLYYAVVSEIRMMREDLEKRYGFGCELGNPILHYYGTDGNTRRPVTAVDLAQLLETAWYTLMDHRLVATLDDAVRMKNLREGAAQEEIDNAVKQFVSAINQNGPDADTQHDDTTHVWPPPVVPGLLDICGIEPEVMFDILWTKYKPKINQACLEDFKDESMLTVYRAELHAKEVEATVAASTPLPSATFCTCHHACLCKLKCDTDTNECTCMNGRIRIYHLVREQESRKNEIHTRYVQADQNVPNQFLGAASPILAQMQVAALADPNPVNVEAARKIHEANCTQELHIARKLRDRSDTNDSRLAYVPSLQPPHHIPKDAYPLDFYGGRSPQRYPKMPGHVSTSQSMTAEQPLYSIPVPTRKPVPAALSITENQSNGFNIQRIENSEDATSLLNGSNTTRTISNGLVTYPTIPKSRSQGIFTRSLPAANAGDPCDDGGLNSYAVQQTLANTSSDPAHEYACLLDRHPSTIEHNGYDNEPLPALWRSNSPSPRKKEAIAFALPTLKTLNALNDRPQPALPQPDFMAPQPALKQRYVSAGGNAKLSEREEIAGPALKPAFPHCGGRISKDELNTKLSDPEWVKHHFGEAAFRTPGPSSPPRPSVDSSKRSSVRRSAESDHSDKGGDKRDRTSSGASGRIAKLKRVFSSKRSSSGEEE